jgi:hypothetical protein
VHCMVAFLSSIVTALSLKHSTTRTSIPHCKHVKVEFLLYIEHIEDYIILYLSDATLDNYCFQWDLWSQRILLLVPANQESTYRSQVSGAGAPPFQISMKTGAWKLCHPSYSWVWGYLISSWIIHVVRTLVLLYRWYSWIRNCKWSVVLQSPWVRGVHPHFHTVLMCH